MSFNLFDNPMIQNAKKNMTASQIAQYEAAGLSIPYDLIDGSKQYVPPPTPYAYNPEYILQYVQNGLPVSELTQQEIDIMRAAYGENWMQTIVGSTDTTHTEDLKGDR